MFVMSYLSEGARIWLNHVHSVDLLVLVLLATLDERLCTNIVLGTTGTLCSTLMGSKGIVLHISLFNLHVMTLLFHVLVVKVTTYRKL